METNKQLAVALRDELRGLRQSINSMLVQFQRLHSPIRESQEKMPVASQQLQKITAETEAATNRVLDMAEAITGRESTLITKLSALHDQAVRLGAAALDEEISACRALSEQNRNDTFAIMEALQFQDITSQQINHTMDLLQDIESRLGSLLEVVEVDQELSPPPDKPEVKKQTAYDPNAQFTLDQTGQKDVDSVINSFRAKP
jgi:chemotaxis regulatin CheY-phosphate phosphatase CheZ